MIEREHFRSGHPAPDSMADAYPDPVRMSSPRVVRTAGERDYDLDDAWWIEPPTQPEWGDQSYEEWMAEQGYVQVMLGEMRVWRHQ